MPAKLTAANLLMEMKALGNKQVASHALGFFKTGPGEYGEGDRFLGIRMPVIRRQVPRLREHALSEIQAVLHSEYHEIRMLALLALVDHYQHGDERKKAEVVHCYLNNITWINNWDLVDCSAHKILGPHLQNRDRKPLFRMARSANLWERRIAIIVTFHFIRFSGTRDISTTLALAEILLEDDEDLIHKAVGWMLREAGKFDSEKTEQFLQDHYHRMPRTMLRYAIEKLPQARRKAFLQGQA